MSLQIYPLDTLAQPAARAHADIHLRPSIVAISKILSDAIFFKLGKENVPQKTNNTTGEIEYWSKDCRLYPPPGKYSVWSKWAAMNQYNAWWLVDFAYQLNDEYKKRFEDSDTPAYFKIQSLVLRQNLGFFPRPLDREGPKMTDEFPVVLPLEAVMKMGDLVKMSVVDIYRSYYATQKGKVRMKWTKRDIPSFMAVPF